MKKKLISALLCAAMVSSMLVGCGGTSEAPAESAPADSAAPAETAPAETAPAETAPAENAEPAGDSAAAGEGSVYYLNFKPEVDAQWQEIAAAYTQETGVPVKVVTAASGTYEEVLKSEIAGSDAPTLFQINGPVGYSSWKDYCLDLSGSDLYNNLNP